MSNVDIVSYLNSLPDNTNFIDVSNKGITYLPDLTRFKNLEKFSCSHNKLTSLPTLPQNLQILYCDCNNLTSLPTLPQNLKTLDCKRNQLISLQTLPQDLEELNCSKYLSKIRHYTNAVARAVF